MSNNEFFFDLWHSRCNQAIIAVSIVNIGLDSHKQINYNLITLNRVIKPEWRGIMKNSQIIGLTVAAVFLAVSIVVAGPADAGSHPQTMCPVMGGKIDKAQYVDYDGKRIYFCCAMCKGKFNADPAKYIKKLEDDGVVLEKAPESGAKDEGAHQGGHDHNEHKH